MRHSRDGPLRNRFPFWHKDREVSCIAARDGNVVVTADLLGKLIVWDAGTGTEYRRREMPASVTALSWVNRGCFAVALETEPPSVQFWDHPSGPKALPAHTLGNAASERINAMALDARGFLHIASDDRAVSVYNVGAGQPRHVTTHTDLDGRVVGVSTGPLWAVAGVSEGALAVFSVGNNRHDRTFSHPRRRDARVSVRAIVVIGDCLVSAGSDCSLVFSSLPTGELITRKELPFVATALAILSPDRIALGFANGRIDVIPLPASVPPLPEPAPQAGPAEIAAPAFDPSATTFPPRGRGRGGGGGWRGGGFNFRGRGRGRGHSREPGMPVVFPKGRQEKRLQKERERLARLKADEDRRKAKEEEVAAKEAEDEERRAGDIVAGVGVENPTGPLQAMRAAGGGRTAAEGTASAATLVASTTTAAAMVVATTPGVDTIVCKATEATKKANAGPATAVAGPASSPETGRVAHPPGVGAGAVMPGHAPLQTASHTPQSLPQPLGDALEQDDHGAQRPSRSGVLPVQQPHLVLDGPGPNLALTSGQQPTAKQALVQNPEHERAAPEQCIRASLPLDAKYDSQPKNEPQALNQEHHVSATFRSHQALREELHVHSNLSDPLQKVQPQQEIQREMSLPLVSQRQLPVRHETLPDQEPPPEGQEQLSFRASAKLEPELHGQKEPPRQQQVSHPQPQRQPQPPSHPQSEPQLHAQPPRQLKPLSQPGPEREWHSQSHSRSPAPPRRVDSIPQPQTPAKEGRQLPLPEVQPGSSECRPPAVAGNREQQPASLSNRCSVETIDVASTFASSMRHILPRRAVDHGARAHLASGGQGDASNSRKRVAERTLERGDTAGVPADGSPNPSTNGTVALYGAQAPGPVVSYPANANGNAVQSAVGDADMRRSADVEALKRQRLNSNVLSSLRVHELATIIAACLTGYDPRKAEECNLNFASVYKFLEENEVTGEHLVSGDATELSEFQTLLSAHLRREGLEKVGNKIRLKRFMQEVGKL